ncbi:MAG: bacteriorhodopsin [Flavobacterium sp.]
MNINVYSTLIFSVTIQAIVGLIDILVVLLKVPSEIFLLKQLLIMEVIVQIVEGSFYSYWLYNFKAISNVTPKRYADWSLTTPTMLVTLIFYLIFLQYNEVGRSHELEFFDLFKKNLGPLTNILSLNWMMLIFGYLSETKLLPTTTGVLMGFVPFLAYFYMIYTKYAVQSADGYKIFGYFLFFWSLYGVAALLPYNIKNMSYNILDLFSKNFFSVFLAYTILTRI